MVVIDVNVHIRVGPLARKPVRVCTCTVWLMFRNGTWNRVRSRKVRVFWCGRQLLSIELFK